MKLTVNRHDLQQGLARIQGVVEKRNTMPILSNVHLEASRGRRKGVPSVLRLQATDLEVGLRSEHAAEVGEEGGVTVSARKFYEIVRELPDEPVELATGESHYLEIRCARSRFTLAGTAPDEYPTMPGASPDEMATLQASVLSTMIERTLYATSLDETRYNLNGVHFERLEDGEKIRMVATDGHRLACTDRTVGPEAGRLASGLIIPRKALQEIKRIVDEDETAEVELGFSGNSGLLRKGGVTLVMRLIEGEFPNYRQVIPTSPPHRITVDALQLAQALRRTVLLAAERTRAVRLELQPGTLILSSASPDLGEAREELDVDFEGEPLKIGFNARYLLDAIGSFGAKELELGLRDGLSPVLVRPTDDLDTLAVVMPMRI